jgi:hypothetical protein
MFGLFSGFGFLTSFTFASLGLMIRASFNSVRLRLCSSLCRIFSSRFFFISKNLSASFATRFLLYWTAACFAYSAFFSLANFRRSFLVSSTEEANDDELEELLLLSESEELLDEAFSVPSIG